MPSRNYASDDIDDYGMPDLPGDLFDDEDEELYERRPRRAPHRERDPEEWEDARPAPRERTRRPRRQDTDFHEEPSRRKRERPRRRDDDDVYEAVTRRDDRLVAGDYISEERVIQTPPRMRPATDRRRRPRRPQGHSRHDRVIERPRMQAEAATMDVVTSVVPSRTPRARRRPTSRHPAWSWKPVVLPQPRQVAQQMFPNMLMALTAVVILLLTPYIPQGLPLWAPLLMTPMLVLGLVSNRAVHPMWARAGLVNLVTIGVFFPMVIVRQSALRVPFVEWGNGTLMMPIVSTLSVVVVLAVLAAGSAYLAEEDPEYAGIVFLPAALLIPFFAGATEITSLRTALMVLAAIYAASAVLTVVASMLPGAFPTLVAPLALALEFLVLPMAESTPIFPVGAGVSAKLLFFVLLFVGVGLTIAVPMLAVWMRQVHRIVVGSDRTRAAAMAA